MIERNRAPSIVVEDMKALPVQQVDIGAIHQYVCKKIQSRRTGGEELGAREVEIFGSSPGNEDSDISNCADIADVLTISGVAVRFGFFHFVYSWLADYRSGIVSPGGLYSVE